MGRPRHNRQKDLLRPLLDQITDMGHPLVRLAGEIDWQFLDARLGSVCAPGPGQPGLPTRLVAGFFILKHMENLSDEALCARWVENPNTNTSAASRASATSRPSKGSIATPVTAPKGGQFVLYAKALHGNPFDGHTLGPVIADLERLTGVETRRIHVDKGYRGHNHPQKFWVWISGQVRRATAAIRREMMGRAAIEPVIGHLKAEHRMDRNHLKGREGDRINAVLAAAGYNFGLLLRWLAALLRALIQALAHSAQAPQIA